MTTTRSTDASRCVIGLDLGGTKMLGVVMDGQARVLAHVRKPTPASGNSAIRDGVLDILTELTEAAVVVDQRPRGIAIGTPGFVDSEAGVIVEATNLDVRHLPLGLIVREAFALPTLVVHDVKAAALGEARFGAGQAASHLAFLNLGTGIGVGLILDGAIYGGAAGRAGELGHVCMQRGGPLCACGRHGCLEALAAGPALAHDARNAIRQGRPSQIVSIVNGALDQIDAQAIARAAQAGDSLALELIATAADYLGQAVAGLINLLDLDRVIIGGGMAQMGPLLIDQINEAAQAYLLDEYQGKVPILPSALGADAGVFGAVAAFMDMEQAQRG